MPTHILENAININYLYNALITVVLNNPSILRNGITKYTPIIRSCDHTGWDDFRRDGLRYTFVDTFRLEDFVVASPETMRYVNLITNGSFQHNYNHPLVKIVNGVVVPITLDDILKDPASKTTYSNQFGEQGNTLFAYSEATLTAFCGVAKECPIDVRLIAYNHPVNWFHTYNLLDGNGNVTIKKSILTVIKYKDLQERDMIFFAGTPYEEYILDEV